MHRPSYSLIALALLVGLLPGVVEADKRAPRSEGRGSMSAEQAAEQARKRYGGRVLDVRPTRSNGDGYRVKLLDRGEVRSVVIPRGTDEGRGRGKDRARSGR